jgi:hypothetical protein
MIFIPPFVDKTEFLNNTYVGPFSVLYLPYVDFR